MEEEVERKFTPANSKVQASVVSTKERLEYPSLLEDILEFVKDVPT